MQISSTRQRAKTVSERILGNPTVREHLDDDHAEIIFRWSFDRAEEYLSTLDHIPDEDAQPAIEKFGGRLVRLLRCMNLLVYQLDHELRDEYSQPACEDFLQEAANFGSFDEQAVMLLQTAITYPADWSAKSAFDFLYSFLEPGETV